MTWKNIHQSRAMVLSLVISLSFLLVWAFAAPHFFSFIQQRPGYSLDDPVLKHIPAANMSIYIFTLLYLLIAFSIFLFALKPFSLILALQGYMILSLLRIMSMLSLPLENPEGMINLVDPLVDQLFYKNFVTKDLFFSGHTSIIFLLAFCSPNRGHKILLLCGGSAVGVMLLIQHAHYFIDVAAAPFFAYASFVISRYFLKLMHREDHFTLN